MQSDHNQNLDRLLNDLKLEYQQSNGSEKTNKNNSIENLLNEVKTELNTNKEAVKLENNPVTPNNSQVNNYLASIKAQYKNQQNQQKTQQDLIYNKNQQDIIAQEQQKQLQHKQLVRQAEKWLANLDPFSDEGMWFNQLAESYPSRLDAAISYLSTTDQSSF